MTRYYINGLWQTPTELSESSGIPPHTIRDRLRRGYSIEEAVKLAPLKESVKAFVEASYYEDWIGMSTDALYQIHWKWCIDNGYTPAQKQEFSRQIMSIYPMLKIVPTKIQNKYYRIIRLRGRLDNVYP